MPEASSTATPATRRRTHAILLAAWGVMLGLAFPPVNAWPLAYLALVPLVLLAIRTTRRWAMAVDTFIAATVWWLVMCWWIALTTAAGYVVLAMYLALYSVAFVVILRRVNKRLMLPLVLTVPIIWVGLEYLRGSWVLTGFPWFNLGQSQPTVMIQIADTVGSYGVSFVVAMTAGMICDVLTRPLVVPGRLGWGRFGMPLKISIPICMIAFLGSLLYGVIAMNRVEFMLQAETYSHRPAIRVAVIQTNVPQSNKEFPSDEQDAANYIAMAKLTEQATAHNPKPDLIAWPETMTPRPIDNESYAVFRRINHPDGEYRQAVDELVDRLRVPLIVGAHAHVNWTPSPPPKRGFRWGTRYNSAYLVQPDKPQQRYDKIHRVPFGEYIPGADLVPALRDWLFSLTPYQVDYTLGKGSEYTVFDVPVARDGVATTWRVAAPICFEDVVSYVPRHMLYAADGTKRADLLVNLSNDGWFLGSGELRQHEQIARFRCVELRVPMARAVNRGYSGFIDSCGRIVGTVTNAAGDRDGFAGYGVATLTRDPRTTLFGRIGDAFAAACFFATVGLFIAALIRKPPSGTTP